MSPGGGTPPGRDPAVRGTEFLLAHLTAMERLTSREGRTALARLEARIGPELSRHLLTGLVQRSQIHRQTHVA